MARTTKTIVETEQVDVDSDGDIDATVTTTTTLVMEGDQVVESSSTTEIVEDSDSQNEEPGGEEPPVVVVIEPRAAGACGETACWSRTAVDISFTNAGRTYYFTPDFPGNVAWDFGDGSPVVVGRGEVSHTYTGAGARTVKASPVASSLYKPGTEAITVA